MTPQFPSRAKTSETRIGRVRLASLAGPSGPFFVKPWGCNPRALQTLVDKGNDFAVLRKTPYLVFREDQIPVNLHIKDAMAPLDELCFALE